MCNPFSENVNVNMICHCLYSIQIIDIKPLVFALPRMGLRCSPHLVLQFASTQAVATTIAQLALV